MKIINRITWICMKQNKKRTLVTIFGVIICVAMITAVCLIATSLQASLITYSETQYGTYEILFDDLNQQQTQAIKKDGAVKEVMRSGHVGNAQIEGIDRNQQGITIVSADLDHLELLGAKLASGRLPKTSDEILLPDNLLENENVSFHIGDTITLPIGTYETIPMEDGSVKAEFHKKKDMGFTITGIMDTGKGELSLEEFYRLMIPYDETLILPDTYGAAMSVHNEQQIFEDVARICEENHILEYMKNTSLLMYKGISDTGLIKTIFMTGIFLGIIILIGGVSLIYNAFSISLSERSRYLGMLSSVGATKKQKRFSVLFEAGIIGILAIPMGLLSGIAGIVVTFYILNPMVKNVMDDVFELQIFIQPWGILVPILFSVFVLLLSAWIPSIKASRISAISAIRQQGDYKIRKKDIHTSRMIRKLFGIEAELGLKNTKRNHSRYLATLFSLIICIVLFMSAIYFSASMKTSVQMTQNDVNADYLVDFYQRDYSKINHDFMKELKQVSSAQSSKLFSEEELGITDQVQFTKEAQDYMEETREANGLSEDEFRLRLYPHMTLQVLDDELFEDYCKEIGMDVKEMDEQQKPSVILVNTRTTRNQDKDVFANLKLVQEQAGDTIQFQANKYVNEKWVKELQEISILKTTNIVPSINAVSANDIELIAVTNMHQWNLLNQKLQEDGCEPVATFFEIQYRSKDTEALGKEIQKIIEHHQEEISASFNDISGEREKQEQQYLLISTFLYGFVILILLVCIANIMNTISTSVSLRKREFAMIKSIGITPQKFHRMIAYETIFYGIKAVIYGIPLGLMSMLYLNHLFEYSFQFEFDFPWFPIVAIIVGVFVVLGITMSYAIHKIKDDHIVETIRNESI